MSRAKVIDPADWVRIKREHADGASMMSLAKKYGQKYQTIVARFKREREAGLIEKPPPAPIVVKDVKIPADLVAPGSIQKITRSLLTGRILIAADMMRDYNRLKDIADRLAETDPDAEPEVRLQLIAAGARVSETLKQIGAPGIPEDAGGEGDMPPLAKIIARAIKEQEG